MAPHRSRHWNRGGLRRRKVARLQSLEGAKNKPQPPLAQLELGDPMALTGLWKPFDTLSHHAAFRQISTKTSAPRSTAETRPTGGGEYQGNGISHREPTRTPKVCHLYGIRGIVQVDGEATGLSAAMSPYQVACPCRTLSDSKILVYLEPRLGT